MRAAIVGFLPRLRRFCIAIAGGVDAGDELVQATVERALAKGDQWIPGSRLDSWMYRIAQNLNIDRARAIRTRGTQVDIAVLAGEPGIDGRLVVEQRSELDAAIAAISLLSEDQRALMALIVFDGLSYREAADILDIPIGSVMSRLARARDAIDLRLRGNDRRRKSE
jgi:RNA polymerase sigma-70 factor (ECF subfamily)